MNTYTGKFENKKINQVDFASIDPRKSLVDYFGESTNRKPHSELCSNSQYKMFQDKFKEIFKTGYQEGLHSGEIQILITHCTNGKYLDQVSYDSLNDISDNVKKLSKDVLSFIKPELHAFLLRTRYHDKNKYQVETPENVKKITDIILELIKRKAPVSKFTEFAENLATIY